MGLDIGTLTCGVAVSDPLGFTAQSVTTLYFGDQDWAMLAAALAPLIAKYEPDTLVIGYPTYPSGDKSQTTLRIEAAATVLAAHFSIPQVFISENFSTKEVEQRLAKANVSAAKRKAVKDALAAQVILTDYLARL